jgi:hypothetical protein
MTNKQQLWLALQRQHHQQTTLPTHCARLVTSQITKASTVAPPTPKCAVAQCDAE